MCIFFLPPRCPFNTPAPKQPAITKPRPLRAIQPNTLASTTSSPKTLLSSNETKSTKDQQIMTLYSHLSSPTPHGTQIGRCVAPTSSNSGLCDNLQVRHRSQSMTNDTGFFETCQPCTQAGRQWQKEMRVSIDKGDVCSEAYERAVMDMMGEKKSQVVKRGKCVAY